MDVSPFFFKKKVHVFLVGYVVLCAGIGAELVPYNITVAWKLHIVEATKDVDMAGY